MAAEIIAFEKHYDAAARRFDWQFTRTDLNQFPGTHHQHDRARTLALLLH